MSDSPSLYEYKRTCPDCGKEWRERREKPLEHNEAKKCRECKSGKNVKRESDKTIRDIVNETSDADENNTVKVEDGGGYNSKDYCGNCKHFDPFDDGLDIGEPWGKCKLGFSNPNVEKYTLTHAINNLDRCPFSKEEYEDYEDERLDIVHYFDLCKKHEEGDDDGF